MFRGEIITTTQQLHHYFGTNKYIEENNNNGRLSERGSVDVVIEVVVLWFYLRTARRSPGGRHKTSTFSFFLFYDLGYYSFKMSFWGGCPQQQLPSLVLRVSGECIKNSQLKNNKFSNFGRFFLFFLWHKRVRTVPSRIKVGLCVHQGWQKLKKISFCLGRDFLGFGVWGFWVFGFFGFLVKIDRFLNFWVE